MWFKKKEPMSEWRYAPLAVYNAERSRGLVHTKKYSTKMEALRKDYLERQKAIDRLYKDKHGEQHYETMY